MPRLRPNDVPYVEHLANGVDASGREVCRQMPIVPRHSWVIGGLIVPPPMNEAATEHGQRVVKSILDESHLSVGLELRGHTSEKLLEVRDEPRCLARTAKYTS